MRKEIIKFVQKAKFKRNRKWVIGIVVLLFACIATLLQIFAKAEQSPVVLEAENSVRSGNAEVANSSEASNGKTLRFKGNTTPVQTVYPKRTTPLSPASGYTTNANLSFGPYGTDSLLDLYIPNSNGPFPLIVYIHGGGWRGYDKSECPKWLINRGFALACVNYRYSTTAVFPAQTVDNKMAVRWLRANATKYNIWPYKIGSMGLSSGGHLASLLGVSNGFAAFEEGDNRDQSSDISAVYSGYGVMDLIDLVRVQPSHDNSADIGPMLIGKDSISGFPSEAKYASPTNYIDSKDAPHLLHHGTGDTVIPWQQSQLMHDKLTAAGVESTLRLLQGAGHGTGEFGDDDILDQVVSFFDKHLR
ncbi:alpha/beta hydrolase [Candidatus Saccharibacteria bacterium]|nr:alpha/beta hydrolase [Candidatus Saccharibacteria bacterium]